MQTTKRIFWVAVIVALGLAGYSLLGSKGSIVITSPIDNTVVYLDGVSYRTLDKEESLTIRIETGTHNILTSSESYFPWAKDIIVEKGKTINLSPFMLSSNPSGEIITGADPEYEKIKSLVQKSTLPISESRKKSNEGNVEIWATGSAIFANWTGDIKNAPEYFCIKDPCDPILEVFKGAGAIENLDFYKDREDLLIFASGNGVFAIEMDPRGIKNFQPIFTGTRPHFSQQDPQTFYILDGDQLAQLAF